MMWAFEAVLHRCRRQLGLLVGFAMQGSGQAFLPKCFEA